MATRYLSAKQAAFEFQAPKRLDARALPADPADALPPAEVAPAPSDEAAADADDGAERALSREQRRSRRKREVRARTVSVKRMTKRELELGRLMYPDQPGRDYERPKTRAECANGPRPCPFVSCAHNLYLDVSAKTGAIKLNYPDLEPDQMAASCSLDVADRGGVTLEETGAIMNLTRERIRQLEVKALAKMEALDEMAGLRDFVDPGPAGKRRLPVLRVVGAEGDGDEADDDEGEAVGPAAVAALADEFDTEDGFVGISTGALPPPPARWQQAVRFQPRYADAKRLAAKLVSFEFREFSKMFAGSGDSECLARLVREGYLERTDRGRYVTTEKLDAEAGQ